MISRRDAVALLQYSRDDRVSVAVGDHLPDPWGDYPALSGRGPGSILIVIGHIIAFSPQVR